MVATVSRVGLAVQYGGAACINNSESSACMSVGGGVGVPAARFAPRPAFLRPQCATGFADRERSGARSAGGHSPTYSHTSRQHPGDGQRLTPLLSSQNAFPHFLPMRWPLGRFKGRPLFKASQRVVPADNRSTSCRTGSNMADNAGCAQSSVRALQDPAILFSALSHLCR